MDELELEDEDQELNMEELIHPKEETASTSTAASVEKPAEADKKEIDPEAALRKQHFQALSKSVAALLTPAASLSANPPSSSTASSASSSVHPLTILLSHFLRGFRDLYAVATALNVDGEKDAGHPQASSTVVSAPVGPKGWPAVQRTAAASVDSSSADSPATDARRARLRGESAGGANGLSLDVPTSPLSSTIGASSSPISVYPYTRHARTVLSFAREDLRSFLSTFTQLLLDALRACEEKRRAQVRKMNSGGAGGSSSKSRRNDRRNDPALRRVEREFLLLSRLVSQLVSHHVLSQLHRTLFPLYLYSSQRKSLHLQQVIEENEGLGFEEMGLSEELRVIAPRKDKEDDAVAEEEEKETAISYDHASQYAKVSRNPVVAVC